MFERFTDDAIETIVRAQYEARKREHAGVDTAHILLALVNNSDSAHAEALKSSGLDLDIAREVLGRHADLHKGPAPKELPFTQSATGLLLRAFEEAKPTSPYRITSKHFLVAFTRDIDGSLLKELVANGLDCNFLRAKVMEIETRPSGVSTDSNFLRHRLVRDAVSILNFAEQESKRTTHNWVGTEQILLALLIEGKSLAAKLLNARGVNLDNARIEVGKIIGVGNALYGSEHLPLTPRSKRVLEFSWVEAQQLGHTNIGTAHILLGLIREHEGVAMQVLNNLGVDTEQLQEDAMAVLKDGKF